MLKEEGGKTMGVLCGDEGRAMGFVGPALWFDGVKRSPGRSDAERKHPQWKVTGVIVYASALMNVLDGLERGMGRDIEDAEEDAVEEVVGLMEEDWAESNPNWTMFDKDGKRAVNGHWRLLYTSSSTTRFAKGVSGVHLYLPQGRSEELTQVMDLDYMEMRMTEAVSLWGGKTLSVEATGKLSRKNPRAYTWDPETWQVGFWKNAASGNRTIRSFCVGEITFVDEDYRIDRGTTDQLYIWKRIS